MMAVPVQSPMVKEAMRQLGHPIQPYVKRPLPRVTKAQRDVVTKSLVDLGALEREG